MFARTDGRVTRQSVFTRTLIFSHNMKGRPEDIAAMKEILLSRPFSASPLEFNMHFQEMMAEIFAENIPQVYRDCRFRIARSLTVPIHFRLTRRLRAQHLSFSKDPTAKTPSAQQVKAVEHGSTLICAAAPSPSAPRLLRSSLLSADARPSNTAEHSGPTAHRAHVLRVSRGRVTRWPRLRLQRSSPCSERIPRRRKEEVVTRVRKGALG